MTSQYCKAIRWTDQFFVHRSTMVTCRKVDRQFVALALLLLALLHQTMAWMDCGRAAALTPTRHGRAHACTNSLWSKKKGAGDTNAPAVSKKMQVKMLKHVAGTGQAGEIVLVTPAFYQNKLRPQKAAMVITDEEVARQQKETLAAQSQQRQEAQRVREILEANDFVLELSRKAGPEGQLFGGISPKILMDELQKQVNDDYLASPTRAVRIAEILDEQEKPMSGDIKHVGRFAASISLGADVTAKFAINVQAEN